MTLFLSCFGSGNGPGLPGSASRSARVPGRQGAEFSLRSQELPAAASASRRQRSRARASLSPCHTNGNRSDDGHDSGRPLVRDGNLPAICRPLTRGARVARTGSAGGRSGGAARWDGCRFGRRVERAFDVSRRGRFPRPQLPGAPRQQPIRAERQRPAKELVQHSSARGHVAGVPRAFAVIAVTARRHRRHSAGGPHAGTDDVTVGTCMQTQRGRPRRNGPWPVSPAAPGNGRGSRGSRGCRPLLPRATRGEKCMPRHNEYTKSHLFLLAIHAL